MSRTINFLKLVMVVTLVSSILSGCSIMQNEIKRYSGDKEQCFLDSEDATQFTYMGNSYIILNDTVSSENLGEWCGYIRQLAAVNEHGIILVQENIENASFKTLSDLSEKAPDAKYIIPYLNVYTSKNATSYLIVDVNGNYHKALPSNQISDESNIFDISAATKKAISGYKINPQDATQLIFENKIYQVTDEVISEEQLGTYLDMLNETVIFDVNSKKVLTKNELNKIDWDGTSSENRKRWFYMDIYEIAGIDIEKAIAVKVNNQYYMVELK